MKNELERQYYVLITERDVNDPLLSSGAIIHEQYTQRSSIEDILGRAGAIGGVYGRVRIARLEFITEWSDTTNVMAIDQVVLINEEQERNGN